MLSILGVTKEYQPNGTKMQVLDEITLNVEEGTFFAIVGTSGCGKSTLLRIIAGLEESTEGKVFHQGREITKPNTEWGMVFQDHALFPWRNVQQNVELGLELRGIKGQERQDLAKRYIELVGLSPHLTKLPSELSGGMKRRVSLARTFVTNPSVLLMDEPFAALDAQTKMEMQKELLRIWSLEKQMVLFVTHDVDEAIFLADIICVLSSSPGKVKEMTVNNIPRNEDGSRNRKSIEFGKLEEHLFSLIDKGW